MNPLFIIFNLKRDISWSCAQFLRADWAFAAKSVLESRYAIQNAVSLIPFSAQQGFTCSAGTQFCGGGSPSKGWYFYSVF